ncbi:hypothetical protein Emed_003802 [Eimeria media]
MSTRGGGGWSATYSKQYGKERWKVLLNALADPPNQIAFVSPRISHSALRYLLRKPQFRPCLIPNCFIPSNSLQSAASNTNSSSCAPIDPPNLDAQASHADGDSEEDTGVRLSMKTCTTAELPVSDSFAGTTPQGIDFDSPIIDDDHVVEEAREMTYFLDGASALAAYALDARPGEVVLDMCAAPGGKSLIISSMLCSARTPSCLLANQSTLCQDSSEDAEVDEGGMLVCNDASRQRLIRQRLQFSCSDGSKGGAFGTPKACAERQLKMLLIATKLLKRNGIILYTTCSLSHTENEGVIEKLLTKAKVGVRVLPLFDDEWPSEVKLVEKGESARDMNLSHSSSFFVEKLVHGYMMLPDTSSFGPMYFCRMQVVGK